MKFSDGFDGLDESIRIYAAAADDDADDLDISINDDDDDEEEVEVLTSSDDDDVSDDTGDEGDELIPHDSHAEEAVIADELPSTAETYTPAGSLSKQPERGRSAARQGTSLKSAAKKASP